MNYVLLLLGLSSTIAAQESPIVELPGLGTLRGGTAVTRGNRTIFAFLGVPYAKPPSGERRFLPPVDLDPWEEILEVTEEGRKCPQSGMDDVGGDVEDCLTLDVYTHQISDDANYPVMLFIHGGGFTAGSSGTEMKPDFFMDEEIVLVSIQYRLGLLGSLSLQTDDIPGNAGMLDQLKAMQWVQKNIGSFGGDPNRVTLWGQSAGSLSVHYHLVSPLSANLYQQAILESGSILMNEAVNSDPVGMALEIAELLGCSLYNLAVVASCFRSASAADLVSALGQYQSERSLLGKGSLVSPVVIQTAGDIRFLEEDPIKIFETGRHYKVPIMSGTTKNEALGLFLIYASSYLEPNNFTTDVELRKDSLMEALLGENGILDPGHVLVDAIQMKYFGNASMDNFEDLIPGIVDFMSLAAVKGPTYRAMQINSRYEKSFWYAFNYYQPQYSSPNKYNIAGIDHSAEMKYLYPRDEKGEALDDEGELFSLKIVKLFANFAIYGEPTAVDNPVDDVPDWPPYRAEDEFYLRMDKEFVMLDDFKNEFTIASQEGLPQPQTNFIRTNVCINIKTY